MSIFDTHFDLESRLASGGYGVVHSCTNRAGQQYAVKCILNQNQGIPCLFEACIMSSLKHPYINSAIIICCDSKKLNIIQERALSDLKTYINNQPPFTFNQYTSWFSMITQSVQFLHNHQIIHGDIKAHNILIYSNNSLCLTDFTLSTKSTWPLESYNFCTASHRPYEIWTSDPTLNLEKVDIWSLGCTFYEILTGNNLFPVQKKDESINALIDWSKINPDPISITKKPIDYKSHNPLPTIPSTLLPLYNLTFTLLKFTNKNRPDINTVLSSLSELTEIQIISVPSPIKNTTKKLSSKTRERLHTFIKKYQFDETSLEMIYNLYTAVKKLNSYSDHMKILGCAWIIHKLVKRKCLAINPIEIPIHEIYQLERTICHNLNFCLPIF